MAGVCTSWRHYFLFVFHSYRQEKMPDRPSLFTLMNIRLIELTLIHIRRKPTTRSRPGPRSTRTESGVPLFLLSRKNSKSVVDCDHQRRRNGHLGPDNMQFCFIASMIKIFSCKNKLAEAELVAIEFISIKIALHAQYTHHLHQR